MLSRTELFDVSVCALHPALATPRHFFFQTLCRATFLGVSVDVSASVPALQKALVTPRQQKAANAFPRRKFAVKA
jgi:hypothetical protein